MEVSPVPDAADATMLNDSLDETIPPPTHTTLKSMPPAATHNNVDFHHDLIEEEEHPVLFSNPSQTTTTTTTTISTVSSSLINSNNNNSQPSDKAISPLNTQTSQSTPPPINVPTIKIAPCFGKKKKNTTTSMTNNKSTAVINNNKSSNKETSSSLKGTSSNDSTLIMKNDTMPISELSATPTTNDDSKAEPNHIFSVAKPSITPTGNLSATPSHNTSAPPIKKSKKVTTKTTEKKEEKEKKRNEKHQEKERKLKEKKEAREKKLQEKKEEKERAEELKRFLQEEKKLEKKIQKEKGRLQAKPKTEKKDSPKCILSVQTESIIITSPVLPSDETTPTTYEDTPILYDDTPTQSDCNPTQQIIMPSVAPPTYRQPRGLWVQCDNPECHKWRYLNDCTDPSNIPDKWYCSMNTDTTYNTCDANEEVWSELGDNEEYVYCSYVPGSIVLAKLEGYPWWPAMIEPDPDNKCYYDKDSQFSTPDQYHVVFFDTPVSRGWVHVLNISPFMNETSIKQCGSQIPSKYMSSLSTALSEAHEALELSLTERVSRWGFHNRYGNRKRKSSSCGSKKTKTKCSSKRRKSEKDSSISDKENIPEDVYSD